MTVELSEILTLCEDIPCSDGNPPIPKGTKGKIVARHGNFVHVELPVGVIRVVEKRRIHSHRNAIFGYYLEEQSAGSQDQIPSVVHVEETSGASQVQKSGETIN